MNKEKRNKNLILFPLWVQCIVANLHTKSQFIVVIPKKNDCPTGFDNHQTGTHTDMLLQDLLFRNQNTREFKHETQF